MRPTAEELLAAMPMAAAVVGADGRLSLVNAAAAALLGPLPENARAADWLPSPPWHLTPLPGGGALALLPPDGAPAAALAPAQQGRPGESDPFAPLAGASPAMAEVRRQGALAARSRSTVLILGESGTGKEVLARAIHRASPRAAGPFVPVNCAAVPEGLLEAEFFGYADGAFTGARRGGKPGKFELAHGGTLFLDEIGDLAPALQAKLLRVLQDREVERVGDTRLRPVDVRLVAASNRPLQAMVAAGTFRPDLYFRLHVIPITLPPLRERMADLPLLADYLLARLQAPGAPVARLTPAALAALQQYHWPGNVRELENVLERALALEPGATIGTERLHLPSDPAGPATWRGYKRLAEAGALLAALEQAGGNKAAAARLLGLSRSQLYAKLQQLKRP